MPEQSSNVPRGTIQGEHIYCDLCGSVQPMMKDCLKPNERNDHGATDLVCRTCCHVVATVHDLSDK